MQIFICDSLLEDENDAIWGLQMGQSIPDFSCNSLEIDKKKTRPLSATSCSWVNKWRSPDLLLSFVYWTSSCAQHCHRHHLIGSLNKADAINSILQTRKLWLERLSNQPKSTHLVHGSVWIRTQITPAFTERSLSTFYFFFSLRLFPRRPGGFSFLFFFFHLFEINTTTMVAILWVPEVTSPPVKGWEEAHRSSQHAQWIVPTNRGLFQSQLESSKSYASPKYPVGELKLLICGNYKLLSLHFIHG